MCSQKDIVVQLQAKVSAMEEMQEELQHHQVLGDELKNKQVCDLVRCSLNHAKCSLNHAECSLNQFIPV